MLPVWQIADVKSVWPDNDNLQVRLLRSARNRTPGVEYGGKWMPREDSNLDKRNQNPLSYH